MTDPFPSRPGNRLPLVCSALFLLLLFPAGDLRAQKFNSGVFAGLTAAQIDGDNYSGFNKLGMTAGAWVNRELAHQVYWQMALKYVSRGVYKAPDAMDPSLYLGAYQYLEFPLSLHYLHEEKIQVEVGASPEILLRVAFSDENGLLDPATYPDNRRFGLSVFGGGTYWFRTRLGAGIRYTYSALPFRDPQEWNHPRYRGYFHNVLSLTLSYRLSPR
ncbi:MAG: outer membrane beta-barrel protein [Bacteroidales bacterium]